ncbi:MAG: ABC transporter, permease protein 1 (cluster 1, maltose/g3p/polyamine/iron) [uncultured Rubrobacteraceae bacterium]|uniref:ABC transporter, permease protein 1 (Cluster 1, maltose/g3p/polyamine/iron) n=1 Tax=uncultured Rubrobacteraceae bacterium TaxID=349277 RepID=A0A6J4R3W1_9ACTN|nr:MAG: ABC transporter, permease protein 1 (cluster 1, maltose/g3p/polyamine/iron) [uncultured Rubrobacteraceae bacterium]
MATQGVERTGVQPPVARSAGGGRKPTDAGTFTPYLFMAPYLVLFVVFVLVPAVFGIWISLHNWDYLLPGKPWVGLENYLDLFTPNSANSTPFWNSMEATAKFTLFSVPPLVVIPLLVALILNQSFRGRNFFRAVYFAPYVLGVAVIGILWRFILDPNNGLLNYYLGALGLPDSIPWTTSLPWGWVALVGPTVWWTMGFNAVIYLTGLQDVDPALYDAAKVDGANRWQRFRHVTVPGLRPVFLFVVTTTILASANVFGQSYIITQGAPGNETRVAIWYIAQEGLRSFNMGSAAAMSYVLALALALVSLANFALLRYKED